MLISDAMPDTTMLDDSVLERRLDLLASLETLPTGLDPVFEKTIIKGVGFHREWPTCPYWSTQVLMPFIVLDAGLTAEERGLIAEAYDKGILKVLVATCSLAAGINLPARRVILCGARMGRELIGPAMLYVPLSLCHLSQF
jgi:DNA polymerase theta